MPFLMHKEPTNHTVRKTEKGSLNGKNAVTHMSIAVNAYLQTANYQQFAKILFFNRAKSSGRKNSILTENKALSTRKQICDNVLSRP